MKTYSPIDAKIKVLVPQITYLHLVSRWCGWCHKLMREKKSLERYEKRGNICVNCEKMVNQIAKKRHAEEKELDEFFRKVHNDNKE